MLNHLPHQEPDTLLQVRLARWAGYCALVVLITGMLVLAGWQWDLGFLKRPLSHLTSMTALTALNFVLTAISFLFLSPSKRIGLPTVFPESRKRVIGQLLAGFVVLTGFLELAGTIPAIPLHVDQLLFTKKLLSDGQADGPGQMSLNAAFGFILAGVSLLLLNKKLKAGWMPAHYLAVAIGMLGLFALVGYLYQVRTFDDAFRYTPMAIHTAACFLLLSISLLFANPGEGIMHEFTSTYTGGLTARKVLPLVILLPILLGYLRLWGHWRGLFSPEFGVTILVLSIVFILIVLIGYNTHLLNKRDALKRQSEIALQESEELCRLLVSNIRDYAIFMIDPSGAVMSWNEGAEGIKGYTAEEVMGRNMSVFYTDEEVRQGEPERNLAMARQDGRFEKEGWRVRKDGSVFWASIIFTAIYDLKGELKCYSKLTRDITERRKLEQQLQQFNRDLKEQVKEKTAELTGIFERITDAFIAVDKNFRYTYLNKKAGELFRHDPAALIGKWVWDVFPDAIGSATYLAFNKSMAEQRNITNIDYYAPLDLWQENHLYPSPDGLSIFIRDITEQKKREQEITDYKYALDQSSIVSITDQNGTIKHVNENFCKNSKYKEQELIGQDHRILHSGYHSTAFMADLRTTIAGGKIWQGEICNQAKDGTIYWVDTTIFPFLNEKGEPYEYLAIRADISERKKRENELQQSYQDIRHLASHLQDIREEERAGIAREIHDELGQQLTGIKMDLSWISRRIPRESNEIKEKVNGTLELLDTTIKTVRRIATELRPSILDDLGLIAAIEWQSQEFQKRSGIATEFVSSLPEFDGSSAIAIGLFRICQESLTNIARHAEAGKVRITLQEKGEASILLKIEDDGNGFLPDMIGRKKTLGLLGMKERTVMMGGDFEIISQPGKGTTLSVTVPMTIQLI